MIHWCGEQSSRELKNLERAKISKARLTCLLQKHAHTVNTTIEVLESLSLIIADPVRAASNFDTIPIAPFESNFPHGRKFSTWRETQARKWLGGCGV